MADFNEYKGVWVFCEQRQGKLMPTDFELVSEARKLADELNCEVTGLLLGDNVDGIAKELGGYGADKVMVCDSRLGKLYTDEELKEMDADELTAIKNVCNDMNMESNGIDDIIIRNSCYYESRFAGDYRFIRRIIRIE